MDHPPRAWLVGYGSRLVPRVPFEVARPFDDERVVLMHHGADGNPSVLVDDQSRFALGKNTASIADALAFCEPDETAGAGWQVMTQHVVMPFPIGLTLWSTPFEHAWPFELTLPGGPDAEMIHLRGPFDALDVEGLVQDQVQVVARNALPAGEQVTVGYAVDGVAWQQWLGVVRPWGDATAMLLTAQAPAERASALFTHATTIAHHMRGRRAS